MSPDESYGCSISTQELEAWRAQDLEATCGDVCCDDVNAIRAIALGVVTLLPISREWISRRVECVTMVDRATATRDVTVYYSVPEPDAFADPKSAWLPVALVQKKKLPLFYLQGDDDHRVSSLNRRTRGTIAAQGLIDLAQASYGGPIPSRLSGLIHLVATRSPDEAEAVCSAMISSAMTFSPKRTEVEQVAAEVWRIQALRWLLTTFTWGHVVVVPIPGGPGTRHMVSFSYEEETARRLLEQKHPVSAALRRFIEGHHEPTLTSRMRWRARQMTRSAGRLFALSPRQFWFPASNVDQARSYHFQTIAPAGLQISAIELRISTQSLPTTDPYVVRPHVHNPGTVGAETTDFEEGSLARAHLHGAAVPPGAKGLVRMEVRPSPSSTVRGAALVAALVAVVLSLGTAALHSSRFVSSGTAALFLFPAALAAYAAREGEHGLTTSLLVGVRVLAIVAGLCSLAAGYLLILSGTNQDHAPVVSSAAWTAALLVSWTVVIVLGFALWGTRPRPYRTGSLSAGAMLPKGDDL
jgi:hypothetical protein